MAKGSRRSAGILLYRAANGGIEVLPDTQFDPRREPEAELLYNNAGIFPQDDHSVTDTAVATWDKVMHDGIILLDDDAPVGASAASYMGDVVFEVTKPREPCGTRVAKSCADSIFISRMNHSRASRRRSSLRRSYRRSSSSAS